MPFDRMNLSLMKTGDNKTGYVLLVKSEEATGVNGSYCKLTISDGEATETAKIWGISIAKLPVAPGSVVKISVECREYRDRREYIAKSIEPAGNNGYKISDFVEKAPIDPDVMYILVGWFKHKNKKILVGSNEVYGL